jgi:dolichyldiphosphatase
MNGNGYGMPSSHSQFMSFFAVYLVLFLLLRHVPHPKSSPSPLTKLERVGASILAIIGASMVSASRIYLNYHTPKQVLAGCTAGVISALVWFLFTSYLRYSGWIDWGLDLALVKLFRIRDLLMNEDLAEAGWQRWQSKQRLNGNENEPLSRKDQ